MDTTGKGLGIAALIVSIMGAFIPVIGLFIGWAALGLATLSALAGNRGLPVATVAVSMVAFLFLTPSLWVEAAAHGTGYGDATGAKPLLKIVSVGLLAAPIVAMLVGRKAEG